MGHGKAELNTRFLLREHVTQRGMGMMDLPRTDCGGIVVICNFVNFLFLYRIFKNEIEAGAIDAREL